jgi:holo-[acyl-carrier protein] synthase
VILGVGVDLVDVDRMERIIRGKSGDRFVARVFSAEEAVACGSAPDPVQSFAARFAAKEAVVKALGSGFSRGVSPSEVCVGGGQGRRPAVELKGSALQIARDMNVTAIHLSFSHTRVSACALVVIERDALPGVH